MISWKNCKNILCVRPDNMGDVLMSAPAISALKQTFGCRITLLTSSMGRAIARYIPSIDKTITWDAPWVKGTQRQEAKAFHEMVEAIRAGNFDGAVIFTVFSQNPLPSALMLTLASIPLRLSYCRENPYHLLSHWVPDNEPYTRIRHQVQRDLDLVASVGATVDDPTVRIRLPQQFESAVRERLKEVGIDPVRPWLLLHPGVSEKRREYSLNDWIATGKRIVNDLDYQVIVTGAHTESSLANDLVLGIGKMAFNLAGRLTLEEFMTLIRFAPLLISVNTGSIHIAAALKTKLIVLYAMTNPQHTPWKAIGKVLPYSIPSEMQSQNEVLRYLQVHYFDGKPKRVTSDDILSAVNELLVQHREPVIDSILPGYGISNALNFHAP